MSYLRLLNSKVGLKVGAYGVCGGVAIYLATWLPSGAFYLLFQKEILRHDPHEGVGAILWAQALPSAEASEGRDWERVYYQGNFVPLPPGTVRRIAPEGDGLVIEFEEATLTVDCLPWGTLCNVFAVEHRKVGGAAKAAAEMDDGAALQVASRATPARFRMDMGAEERSLYAAALLTKMLLWDLPGSGRPDGASRKARIELFASPAARSSGALLVGPDGTARALVCSPQGVFAFGIRGACPPEWLEAAARWGEVTPADGPAASRWKDDVRQRYPDPDHPLRLWAED